MLKQLSTPKPAVLFPFQITDKHLYISEDNRLTVYDLRTLKCIKHFSYRKDGMYAATLFQNEIYFLYDNHIWKIDKNLKEKKIQKIESLSKSFPFICASEKAIYITFKEGNDNKIWKFQNNKWLKISSLPNELLTNTLQFLNGRLFLSSAKGLLVIHPVTGKIEKRYFSQKNISGVTRDFKNNLWIASPNEGLFLFPNEKLKQNTTVKDLPTKMITVGENLVYTNNRGEITWLNTNNWRELNLGNQNLNLSSLAPNKYTLIFKGFSANKVIFTKKILFTIQNPFWSTWWFLILVSVSVVLAIYLYFRSRIRAVIAKNKLIHEKMSLENDLNKSMITTLKSQMNPHFFYNALKSIQGLVLSGEKEKAGKSIGLFSELSRSVLESTRSNEISLHDEIELLTSYLELECMRLPKIKYQVKVQPDLRQHEIFLPPMLLQPIVENAVKHGLSSKEQEGWLSITFSLEHQNLVVMIDDNGIGRKAAGEKSKLQNRKGSSFSSEANLNRIELMNASYDLKISQEIIDKMDDNQTSTGTIVKVVIPQNEN